MMHAPERGRALGFATRFVEGLNRYKGKSSFYSVETITVAR